MKLFILLLFFIPTVLSGQPRQSEKTDPVFVKEGLFCGIGFSYTSTDTAYSINLYRASCDWMMGTNERLALILKDGSQVILYAKQIGNYEWPAEKKFSASYYIHDYKISLADITKLSSSKLVSVKAFLHDNSTVVDIKSTRQSSLMELSKKFLVTIK